MFIPDNADYVVTIGQLPLGGVDADTGLRWHIDPIDGWGASKSSRSGTQRSRAGGTWSGIGYPSNRAIAVNGRIIGPSTAALSEAFDWLVTNVPLSDTRFSVLEGARERWTLVHRTGEVIPKWVTDKRLEWSFQVESDDWRKFGTELSGVTLLPSTAGGLTIPFTVPLMIDAITVSGQISLTNPGNEVGPVRLRIDGPCTGPVVTHVSSGVQLVFSSSLVLGVGEWIDVDMEAHTVLANGQASRSGWVKRRGWSGFDPGDNTWSFTAAEHDPASQLTVYATPADQ